MSFQFRHLNGLGSRVHVPIPKDEDGYLGRECPEKGCQGYFKIKPGTGLSGENLPCHCPYCGHSGSQDHFWTQEQIEYARSVVMRKVTDAVRADLKSLEFDYKPRGAFGIGISMKLKPGTPVPIRYYREKELETQVTCADCALEYAVYGVFAFCPDCHTHNSLQILERNLELLRKQLVLASSQADADFKQYLIEDALENCVSAFDGFGRECCRIRAGASTDPARCEALSFQNLPRAAARLTSLFAVDLKSAVDPADWAHAHTGFMRRHIIAHRAGVIDQQYLDETGEGPALLGRRIAVGAPDVERLASVIWRLGETMFRLLPPVS